MLKHYKFKDISELTLPAAFRRLCVETLRPVGKIQGRCPAAFRRLCVETNKRGGRTRRSSQPPSGGCVLKRLGGARQRPRRPSRLQAAVC